jgi:serine protease Do
LTRLIAAGPPGKKVKIVAWRDGKPLTIDITLGLLKPPAELAAPAAAEPEARQKIETTSVLGLALAPVNDATRKEFEIGKGVEGVYVTAVEDAGPAAARGLRPGDVISFVGRDKVSDPKQVVGLATAARKQGRKTVLLRILRDGDARYIAMPLDVS